jgi:D-glycero-D-manno-heptose 1,7-bisphosphate phosphatase
MMPVLCPALILDRDGVVNHDSFYVHRIEDCRFIDGVFAMAAGFVAQGFAIVIATNQSGIGRGLYGEAEFATVMDWMKGEFAAHGAPIAGIYHCPDHPTEGRGTYRRDSEWRKPRPGMLLQAAADLGLDLARSWCVGDQMSDIEAGRAAGAGMLVLFDSAAEDVRRREDYWVVPRLDCVLSLLSRGQRGPDAAAKVNEFLTAGFDHDAAGPEDES